MRREAPIFLKNQFRCFSHLIDTVGLMVLAVRRKRCMPVKTPGTIFDVLQILAPVPYVYRARSPTDNQGFHIPSHITGSIEQRNTSHYWYPNAPPPTSKRIQASLLLEGLLGSDLRRVATLPLSLFIQYTSARQHQ